MEGGGRGEDLEMINSYQRKDFTEIWQQMSDNEKATAQTLNGDSVADGPPPSRPISTKLSSKDRVFTAAKNTNLSIF